MCAKATEDELNPVFMITQVIKPLKYGGYHPGYRTWCEKIRGVYCITYTAMTVVLYILNLALESNVTMASLIDQLTMLTGYLQVTAKLYTAITKGDVLWSMLESLRSDFWTINRLDAEPKKSARILYTVAKRISDIYNFVIIFAILLFILKAILKMDRSLVNEVWLPYKEFFKISPYYEILFAIQSFGLLCVGFLCIIPIDQLFIHLLFGACVQFKILQEEMKLLNRGDNLYKKSVIKRIVEHHNTLIRFLDNFENVFSNSLLVTLADNYIIMTMTLYGITYDLPIDQKAPYIFIYASMLGQILAYCIAGQLVHDQSLIVGESAYDTEWYIISDLQIRKDINTIMVRSQREIQLSAGGIMYLNMESFLIIVKTTFSLLAFLFHIRETAV